LGEAVVRFRGEVRRAGPLDARTLASWCALLACFVRFHVVGRIREISGRPHEHALRALVQRRIFLETLGRRSNPAALARRQWVLQSTFNAGSGILVRSLRSGDQARAFFSRFHRLETYRGARGEGKGVIVANFHTVNHGNAVYELYRRFDRLHVVLADRAMIEALPSLAQPERLRFWDCREPRLLIKLREVLAAGETVVLYPDYPAGERVARERCVPVDFLGRTIRIRPGVAALSFLSGSPIVPVVNLNRALFWNEIHFGEVIRPDRSVSRGAFASDALSRVFGFLEPFVARRPELWTMWKLFVPGLLADQAGRAAAREQSPGTRIQVAPPRGTTAFLRPGRGAEEHLYLQLDPFLVLKVDRLGEAMIRLHQKGLEGGAIRRRVRRRFRLPAGLIEQRFRLLFPEERGAA
jgi:lauroyl/myristoyl acyltransferase